MKRINIYMIPGLLIVLVLELNSFKGEQISNDDIILSYRVDLKFQ